MADELNIQLPSTGFDSYLQGIIPEDQAITAGALSVSLRQIRDINKITTPVFAKIVYNMESIKGLNLVAGTDVPVDINAQKQAAKTQALGSGPYGTYTMSNYYGSMSGLSYAWDSIYNGLKNLETKLLATIYQNLYLAVTWERAIVQWTGTEFKFITRGGGYGREGKATFALVGGTKVPVKVGTDPADLSTFGKVISIDFSGPTAAAPVVVDAPPGDGWPAMNEVVQDYINQANAEIADIQNTPSAATTQQLLNAYWRITGLALKLEQRARFLALSPVPVPYDIRLADRPTTVNAWVDSLCGWSSETMPHMHAQTIEHICDMRTLGGQSVIALMRSCRNQERLNDVGIILDNNIPASVPNAVEKTEMNNYTSDTGVNGVLSPCAPVTYTIPANPIITEPYYYTVDGVQHEILACKPGSIQPILDCDPNPIVGPCSPVGPGPAKPRPINPFVVDLNDTPQPRLNSDFTGSTLLPSIYNVNEAIQQVVECNCDCWVK